MGSIVNFFETSFYSRGAKALKQAFDSKDHKDEVTLEHSYTMGGLFSYLLTILMLDKVSLFRQIDAELSISSMNFNDIAMVGALHDLGKQFISREILYKLGKLTDAERAIVSGHSQSGSDVIDALIHSYSGGTDKKLIFADFVAKYHHNARLLRGTKLGPVMEIAQIADIIDATSQRSRSYHTDGVSMERTLSILSEDAKKGKIDKAALAMVLVHLDSIKKIIRIRTIAVKDPNQYLKTVASFTQNEVAVHPISLAMNKINSQPFARSPNYYKVISSVYSPTSP